MESDDFLANEDLQEITRNGVNCIKKHCIKKYVIHSHVELSRRVTSTHREIVEFFDCLKSEGVVLLDCVKQRNKEFSWVFESPDDLV
ncbi:MAG: hypothetical protein QM662_09865 [Gordonia sp. (in: high G+C Gram-positive bacteria)]